MAKGGRPNSDDLPVAVSKKCTCCGARAMLPETECRVCEAKEFREIPTEYIPHKVYYRPY